MNSANSRNLINRSSMNLAQFKDPVSHPGLLHKRQLGGRFEPFYCNDKGVCH